MTTTMNRKSLNSEMTVADGSREMIVKITSSAIDRDGEVLLPDGMIYREFMSNPIVFANHEYGVSDVVGKVVSMTRAKDGWLAKVLMLPRPAEHVGTWMPDTILHMARFGIMGVSVGFQTIDDRKPNKKDIADFGADVSRVISRWKLMELSIAPLPCNQDALILAVSKGMKPSEAKQFWPNAVLPPPRRKVSLAGMVWEQWHKGAFTRAVEDAAAMTVAKMRGRVYWP